jgi:hypothetical protein
VLDGILLEKAGIPAVSIVTDAFVETGRTMAGNWGVPDYRFLAVAHPIANLGDTELEESATGVIDGVVDLLSKGQDA